VLLPVAEMKDAAHLDMLLMNLGYYGLRFYEALNLFDYCQQQFNDALAALVHAEGSNEIERLQREKGRHVGWRGIAARDAAMTVYHFGATLTAIVQGVRKCPTILSLCDIPTLNFSQPHFRKRFSRWDGVRQAIGHSADLLITPEILAKHASHGQTIHEVVEGRDLIITFKWKIIRFGISHDSLEALHRVLTSVYNAFRPAEQELRTREKTAIGTA
jgi:hypothetical protein